MDVCENEFMLGDKNMASLSWVVNTDILLLSVNLSKKPMEETLSYFNFEKKERRKQLKVIQ